MSSVASLLDRARRGDRRAIGRLLTIAERDGGEAEELAQLLLAHDAPGAHVVGMTGAPGAGKSTLTGGLIGEWVGSGRRVAVLAVDPSSPFSGGAILGDRIRMDARVGSRDDQTFIRSLATRGQHGGLAVAVLPMIRVLEAVGYDLVIVETVGVGQVELDIAALADTTVVVVTPGWGDAVQTSKAGLLEIADVFAVNKADRPGAADTVRDLEHMLDLAPTRSSSPSWRAPVCCTVGTDGTGIDALVQAIEAHASHLDSSGTRDERRRVRTREEVRARVTRDLARLIDEQLDEMSPDEMHTAHESARHAISSITTQESRPPRVDCD